MFTKVVKPVIAYLHTQGICIVAYLDDLLLMSQSQVFLREHTALAIFLLQVLGFVINWEKSELNPVQKIIYLGFVIDSLRMTISLPEENAHCWPSETSISSTFLNDSKKLSGALVTFVVLADTREKPS